MARPPFSVVHLAAEYWPFARTGGLGEAVQGIARQQALARLPTVVLLPLYRGARESGVPIKPLGGMRQVTLGSSVERVQLWQVVEQDRGAPMVLLVDHPASFDRAGIYGEAGADYPDNARRFALFCRAALEALPDLAKPPLVLHAHDWHTRLKV